MNVSNVAFRMSSANEASDGATNIPGASQDHRPSGADAADTGRIGRRHRADTDTPACLGANALLNIAIERVLMREGTAVTARILRRLADLI